MKTLIVLKKTGLYEKNIIILIVGLNGSKRNQNVFSRLILISEETDLNLI